MAEETGIKKDKRCFGTALFFKWCHCEERTGYGNLALSTHENPKPYEYLRRCGRGRR